MRPSITDWQGTRLDNKVLVVGAAGFLGTAICRGLVAMGKAVITMGRHSGPQATHPQPSLAKGVRSDSVPRMIASEIGSVIYLASATTPGSSAGQPTLEVNENLAPLADLLEAMGESAERHLIYFSSAGALYGTSPDVASKESDPPMPRSYHGAAKVAAEQFIRAWTVQTGAKATILRPSNVYGPGQAERLGFGIIPTALGSILRDEPLTIWGSGEAVRDYLYIDDLVSLTLSAMDNDIHSGCRILNAAGGHAVSINELMLLVEKITGRRLQRIYSQGRSIDMDRVLVDIQKAEDMFGWQPIVSLEEGLERTWNWYVRTHP
ncbi:NAD-dependent epimerase/dehydratase family protein [Haliea sp.]|uniref:NAD-dependent epimerase/dehydratase family protein n=1 Tax=Haliea sp. TaxID=1932666 RepID=UPI003527E70B